MGLLSEIKWKFLVNHTYFRVCKGASVHIGKNVRAYNSHIVVAPGSFVSIGDNVTINNTIISIVAGDCIIEDHCILGDNRHKLMLNVENGKFLLGHFTKINAERVWIRFGGVVEIGDYTNINSGSEIRCDESVVIGSYNQISYNVNIWDTNTHQILSKEERRRITQAHWPYYGYESAKPETKSINIGNDCWIGQNASVLKGTTMGDDVIVGYNCLLIGQDIPDKTTVVSKNEINLYKR